MIENRKKREERNREMGRGGNAPSTLGNQTSSPLGRLGEEFPDGAFSVSSFAITGGIGSGKSFVCKRLAERGIEVYDCDAGAKRLMRSSMELQQSLQQLVGEGLYIKGVLQKRILAEYILRSDECAQQVDDIIHPAVARDFKASGLHWLESAIYFDSGFDKRVHIDKVICVTAPLEVRISRVMKRDSISREKALEWIGRQLPQDEVLRRSDYEIVNDGTADIDRQIDNILDNN